MWRILMGALIEQTRKLSGGSKAAVVFLVLLVIFTAVLAHGWMLMLGFGILHGEFGWPSSTIGFWPSVGLAGILTGLGLVRYGT